MSDSTNDRSDVPGPGEQVADQRGSGHAGRWIRRILWGGLFVSLGATCWFVAEFFQDRVRRNRETLAVANSQANQAAKTIDQTFRAARELAEALAGDLSTGKLPYTAIEA